MENLKYTEILERNKALTGTISTEPRRISILSNVTINSFKEIMEYNCRVHQIEPEVEIGNFDNIVQDSAAIRNKDLVIVFYDMLGIVDNLGIYFEAIGEQEFNDLTSKIKSEIDLILNNLSSIASVIFNTFSAAYFVPIYSDMSMADKLAQVLNRHLYEKKKNNTILIDMDKLFVQTGVNQAIDYRFYNSSKAPYTVTFLKAYASALQPIILRDSGKLKKALIFDCDNTLWRGIVGEDGANGIEMGANSALGKYFHKIQQIAAYLSKQGIIIGLCSKNNSEDVEEILQRGDMVLRDENLVIKKINWKDKAGNLRSIAHELNIGLDSIVFVDDSSFEINLVKEQLPEVLTFQVPTNIAEYPNQLLRIIHRYFSLGTAAEDAVKTQMYKQQFEREDAKATFSSIDDYLASLEITLTVSVDNKQHIPRIAQLTQKTNQFNLTTKRYTESQIEDFMQIKDAFVFSIFVKDKFGDSGLTGIAILTTDERDKTMVVIDTFLMSCRIIGRNIEHVFLNYVVSHAAKKGYETIGASFTPTKKNAQVATFYDNSRFGLPATSKFGDKFYSTEIRTFIPTLYKYISLTVE